jgi:5-methylcytosine-specific restriction enzyme subunit McrC
MVGVVAAPGCSLEILPKIDPEIPEEEASHLRSRLVRMLNVALGIDIGTGEAVGMASQHKSLLEILIRIFTERLLAETRRGLPRAYLQQEEDLKALRGRLDVKRQFTVHAVRPDRLACRFDALSPDIALMQAMKACTVFLGRWVRSAETRRLLDELRFVLADISDLRPRDIPWKNIPIDRTSRRWEVLLTLARLFLKQEWQDIRRDTAREEGFSLLFPMNDLFEAYVAALGEARCQRHRADRAGTRRFAVLPL